MSRKVGVTLDVADSKINSVRIYTTFPGSNDCRLIARKTVSARQFDVDIYGNRDYVFVEFLDGADKVVSGKYVDINDDRLSITESRARSRAMSTATAGENLTAGMNSWPGVGDNDLGLSGSIKDVLISDMRRLSGDYSEYSDDIFRFSDIWNLVGRGAVFQESAIVDDRCILTRYADEFKVKNGASLTTQNETDIVINYFYGCTEKQDAFGYFYYPKDATPAEIGSATKYVLINDATPGNHISFGPLDVDTDLSTKLLEYLNNYNINEGGSYSELFQSDLNQPVSTHRFRLTYFDENGVAQEKFPEGYTISFFGVINTSTEDVQSWPYCIRFSLPWMNELNAFTHETCHADKCEYSEKKPAYNFITYLWGDRVIVGFEDEGGDDDFNDIMFYVEGDFDKSKLTRITDDANHIKPQGCLLAAEDLGAADDWDFNDLVVGVAVEDKDDGTKIVTVDPLAAGGTLPIHLMYTDKEGNNYFVGPEFHSWFGVSETTMYNTGAQATQPTTRVKFEVPSTFSMSPDTKDGSNMGGFWVLVDRDGEYASANDAYVLAPAPAALSGTSIQPPTSVDNGESTVPYMLCLGADWHWPRERVNINDAYVGGFASWVSDPVYNWYVTGHANSVAMDKITLKPGESPSSVIGPVE